VRNPHVALPYALQGRPYGAGGDNLASTSDQEGGEYRR